MKCQSCGEREANVHLTRIINDRKQELHLCSECAEKTGQLNFSGDPFSFKQLLSGILKPEMLDAKTAPAAEKACSSCGLSYQKFVESGLFGCGDCYDNFSDQVEYILRKVQGGNKHQGKTPREHSEESGIPARIAELRSEMEEAVEIEDFERAAELRDQIEELEAGWEDEDEG